MLSLKTVGFVHIFILHIKIMLETPRAARAALHPGLEGAVGFWGISRAGVSQTRLFPKPRSGAVPRSPRVPSWGSSSSYTHVDPIFPSPIPFSKAQSPKKWNPSEASSW